MSQFNWKQWERDSILQALEALDAEIMTQWSEGPASAFKVN